MFRKGPGTSLAPFAERTESGWSRAGSFRNPRFHLSRLLSSAGVCEALLRRLSEQIASSSLAAVKSSFAMSRSFSARSIRMLASRIISAASRAAFSSAGDGKLPPSSPVEESATLVAKNQQRTIAANHKIHPDPDPLECEMCTTGVPSPFGYRRIYQGISEK